MSSARTAILTDHDFSKSLFIKSNKTIDNIIFGKYAEECIFHCIKIYKLEVKSNNLFFDTSRSFFYPPMGEKVNFKQAIIEKWKIEIAKQLLDSIPDAILNSNKKDTNFNCAGCGDGEILYLQITSNNEVQRVYINPNLGPLPSEIRPFAILLTKALQKLE